MMSKHSSEFVVGQRWLSDNEPELGLGLVVEQDFRCVTLYFPETEVERTYAKQQAPLSRIILKPGKTFQTLQGFQYQVLAVTEKAGCAYYQAVLLEAENQPSQEEAPSWVAESHLSGRFVAESVVERLQAKMTDSQAWFSQRVAALYAKAEIENSPIRGLRGPRIGLIGHQLYIADQVAARPAPRVLLADEVGLGKTIEAGLIIHQQLQTGRASRVLILVPDALVHQWFVEMIRRFNLHFHIFDESRLEALSEAWDEGMEEEKRTQNPFLSEQLLLCCASFIDGLTEPQAAYLAGGAFDLLVVDEAHHLIQTPLGMPHSKLDQRVRHLAESSPGVLLLSATPEQLGVTGHFARLQLLDPIRFSSLEAFLAEQNTYQALAAQLTEELSEESEQSAAEQARAYESALQLLDEKGTGRIFYRNTRKVIQGFPERHLFPVPLSCPEVYRQTARQSAEGKHLLTPERIELPEGQSSWDSNWCEADGRALWLYEFLKKNRTQKTLVICQSQDTALDLSHWLGYHKALRITSFHEGMDLIERDRCAAYFADLEEGAQALICSEIGSEGRNFQFASRLVLFDLPQHPDVLEQRIGRLDRIGQGKQIEIYVPYFKNHAQEVIFRWYHEGMNAFTQTNAVGFELYQALGERLELTLQQPEDSAMVESLIEDTQALYQQQLKQLAEGRDKLLEWHSYQPARGAELIEALLTAEQHRPEQFLHQAFDHYGVDTEPASNHAEHQAWVVRPGHAMRGHFPGLPEEGLTLTYSREQALNRDDWQYMTWEHPMVLGVVEQSLAGQRGQVTVSGLKNKNIPAGTTFIELFYHIPLVAPAALQAERYLPMQVWRFLLTQSGEDIAANVSHAQLDLQIMPVKKQIAQQVVDSQLEWLLPLLEKQQLSMNQLAAEVIQEALRKMQQQQTEEIERLQRLGALASEIKHFKQQQLDLTQAFKQAQAKLAAIRILVATGE